MMIDYDNPRIASDGKRVYGFVPASLHKGYAMKSKNLKLQRLYAALGDALRHRVPPANTLRKRTPLPTQADVEQMVAAALQKALPAYRAETESIVQRIEKLQQTPRSGAIVFPPNVFLLRKDH
jgi:hypothetical protein